LGDCQETKGCGESSGSSPEICGSHTIRWVAVLWLKARRWVALFKAGSYLRIEQWWEEGEVQTGEETEWG
jgi:hypothetical protein